MAEPLREEVTITRLGHRGDGIVEGMHSLLYVAGALPGERVIVERFSPDRARLIAIIEASAQRQAPLCRHFGICGGCEAQHMEAGLYRAWKVKGIADALAQHGIEAPIGDLPECTARSRRRVKLALTRHRGKAILGFHGARSEDVVAIEECPVMAPRLAGAIEMLTALLAPLAPQRDSLSVTVLDCQSGLDVTIEAIKPSRDQINRLFINAREAGLARLTIGIDSAAFRDPVLQAGKIDRVPPPGSFVQAVTAVEERIAAFAVDALAGTKRLIELFAGSGAFTLCLAPHMAVHAVETEGAALASLERAVRGVSGLKPVSVEQRDLFRRPLLKSELTRFDACLIDPPRQGALAQMPALVASTKLKRLVYVACAPSTFARDARILVDGGFRLGKIAPFDQFLWSHHVELAAVFER